MIEYINNEISLNYDKGIRVIFYTMLDKKSAHIISQKLLKNRLSACIIFFLKLPRFITEKGL